MLRYNRTEPAAHRRRSKSTPVPAHDIFTEPFVFIHIPESFVEKQPSVAGGQPSAGSPPPVEGHPAWLSQVGDEGKPEIHTVRYAVRQEVRDGQSAAASGKLAGTDGPAVNLAF